MGRRQYAVHRWVGIIASVQLFLWSLGGFVFAIHSMDLVHGKRGGSRAEPPPLALEQVRLSPAEAASSLGIAGAVEQITLRMLLDRPVYELHHRGGGALPPGTVLVDAATGARRSPVDRDTAMAIALADREGSPAVIGVALIESEPPMEYRNRPLPAWQIALADGQGMHIYVAADTGRIAAHRNDAWRRFDFFWMLHTMDYRGRDDFNTPWLMGFALLGMFSVGSGLVLWGARLRRRWRRRGRTVHGVISA